MNEQGPAVDLGTIRFVKRIEVGSADPSVPRSAESNEAAMQLLNRCLQDMPHGQILEIEKAVSVETAGDSQYVRQTLIYHVGWRRRPSWLSD